jgi:hypothetical protein
LLKKECLALLVAAALIMLPAAAGAYRLDESWHKSFTMKEGGRFVLSNASGSIAVEGWDEERVDVTADIRVKSPSKSKSMRLYRGIRFAEEHDPNHVAIRAYLPQVRQDVFFGPIGEHTSITITYTVHVPRRTPLAVTTIDGDIDVAGVAGDFMLHTDNGSIAARSLDGAGGITTGNGAVDAGFDRFPSGATIAVRAASGPLVLRVPADARARIEAVAVSGGVHVDLPAGHIVEMRRARWSGTLNGGGATVTLHDVSGEIFVRESVR